MAYKEMLRVEISEVIRRWLAGGPQPATYRLRDGTFPGYRRQIHHCGRVAGRIPRGTGAQRGVHPDATGTPGEDQMDGKGATATTPW